jgi:OOP family OmpA-OmpF porin
MPEPAEVKPLPAAPAAEAATVAPAPPRAPDPAPVETATLGAEALFDLSKSSIKPAARAELDALARSILAAPFENVRITGHTDRTGSPGLNRKLSQQRASSVKAYLVARGVPAGKIVAEGRGSSEPRTQPSDCEGVERAQLGACLQPDRRVEIEVRR